MPSGRHVTLCARTLEPARLTRPKRLAPEASALRARLAAAEGVMPPELEGRGGRRATPREVVSALLRWAGDDPAKLRRALRRVLELAARELAANGRPAA